MCKGQMKPISCAVAILAGWLQGPVTLLAVKVPLRQDKVIDTVFDDIRSVLGGAVENLASDERLASLDRLASTLVSLSAQSPSNRKTLKTVAGQIIANIGSTVKPSLLRRHAEVNRTVSKALEQATTCHETFLLGVEAANRIRDTLPSQKAALQHCQHSMTSSAENATSLLRSSAQQSSTACDEFDKITSLMSLHVHDWGSQCDGRDDADVGAYWKKQAAYWDSVLDHYDTLDRLCQQSKEKLPSVELSRTRSMGGHDREDGCGLLQRRMDSDSCTQALDRMRVCAAYDQCSATWSSEIQQHCAEEGRFKQAWSFLEHATCTLRGFMDERGNKDLERSISECTQQEVQESSAAMLLELPSCRRQEEPMHSSEIAECSALWFPGSDANISGTESYAGAYYQGLTPQRCNSSCCLNPPQPPRPSAVASSITVVSMNASVGKRCTSPLAGVGNNYTDLQEKDLQMGSMFSVSVKCASGYTGAAKAVECSHAGEPYTLVGCVGELCVAPLDTTGYVLTDISTERPSFNVTARCATGFTGSATVQACSGDLQDYVLQGCQLSAPLSALALQTGSSAKCFRKECGCPGARNDFPDSFSWCSLLSIVEKWDKHAQMETACVASSDACHRCNGIMCMSQAEMDIPSSPDITGLESDPVVDTERYAKHASTAQAQSAETAKHAALAKAESAEVSKHAAAAKREWAEATEHNEAARAEMVQASRDAKSAQTRHAARAHDESLMANKHIALAKAESAEATKHAIAAEAESALASKHSEAVEAEPVTSNLPTARVTDTSAVPEMATLVDSTSVDTEQNANMCASPQPETFFNYTDVQETNLGLGSNFNVVAKCASGYTGTAMAIGCSKGGEAYQLVGCTGEICTAPQDSAGYVLTEVNTERPSFNVIATCAADYDGTPSVKECPGDLQEYELSGCQATTVSVSLEKTVNSTASAGDVYSNLCFHRDCGCPGIHEDFPESDGWCKMLNIRARWDWHAQMETSCGASADACNLCDGRLCKSKRSMQLDEVANLLTNLVHRSPITSPSAFCFNSVCGCPGELGTFPNSSHLCNQGTNMSKYRYHKPGWCEESELNCRLCHGSWCPTDNGTSR
eukprot:TRINITY_DN4361_c0_g1_i1.p1 TRINITY_DN4361_c0_g1~~TRINITY_DN4361_c0_g1_i1.p1  ORF type:complete len:1097 (-),score=189.88 TRINITY_DN4361_c0_g1_i1:59-3349(-)